MLTRKLFFKKDLHTRRILRQIFSVQFFRHRAVVRFDVRKPWTLDEWFSFLSEIWAKNNKFVLFQASDTISIPKESHGAIIGKGATRVREIEGQTATKIHFPPQNSQEENISIVGTREGIAHAKHRLEVIAAEIAKMAYERIDVPKVGVVTCYLVCLMHFYWIFVGEHQISEVRRGQLGQLNC